MANDDHIALFMRWVAGWNAWRDENRDVRHSELFGANLQSAQLDSALLCGVDLWNADLRRANLFEMDLQTSAKRISGLPTC
jgi:uncharacterized protein YjbI with pentapeptide repeats